jgi:hypothetical protein
MAILIPFAGTPSTAYKLVLRQVATGLYWDGDSWEVAETELAFTESGSRPGSYTLTLTGLTDETLLHGEIINADYSDQCEGTFAMTVVDGVWVERVVGPSGAALATATALQIVDDELATLDGVVDLIAAGTTVVRANNSAGEVIPGASTGGGATLAKQNEILAKLNPARNTSISTVQQDRTVEIAKGADYATGLGTALDWSLTSVDLTGATVQMAIVTTAEYEATAEPSWTNIGTGSVVSYTSGVNLIRVVLTDDETSTLTLTTPPNDKHAYTYRLVVTLSSLVGKPFTGGLTVIRA